MAEEKSQEIGIEFESLDIFPNECELSDELNINASFQSSHSVSAKWIISYVVDSTFTKHVIGLSVGDYQQISNEHTNTLNLKIDKIDVSDINDSSQCSNTNNQRGRQIHSNFLQSFRITTKINV